MAASFYWAKGEFTSFFCSTRVRVAGMRAPTESRCLPFNRSPRFCAAMTRWAAGTFARKERRLFSVPLFAGLFLGRSAARPSRAAAVHATGFHDFPGPLRVHPCCLL